jgi:hypothetical protein
VGFAVIHRSLSHNVSLGGLAAAEVVDQPPFHLLLNATFAVIEMYRRASSDPHCVSAVIEAGTIFLVAYASSTRRIESELAAGTERAQQLC